VLQSSHIARVRKTPQYEQVRREAKPQSVEIKTLLALKLGERFCSLSQGCTTIWLLPAALRLFLWIPAAWDF